MLKKKFDSVQIGGDYFRCNFPHPLNGFSTSLGYLSLAIEQISFT